MATLTWQQAIADARAAGFNGPDLVTIAAIAYAESRLQTNPSGNATHYGILQFDARTAKSAGYTVADVLNPKKAFQAAYNLVYGKNGAPKRGFQPWQGDNSGAYTAQAQQQVLNSYGITGTQDLSGQGSGGLSLSNPLDAFSPSGIAGAVSNSLMDAGRSMLPYLVILVILGFGLILIYSGLKQEVSPV